MSRNVDATMQAGLSAGSVGLAFLVMITFRSSVQYVWSGPRDLTYGGNVYKGVGTLGTIGDVAGGLDVQARGTTVALSGIDPVLLQDCLNDIQVGAPAKVFLAVISRTMEIVGTPYLLYGGTVDVPTVTLSVPTPEQPDATCTISLAIENRTVDGQRAQQQRYTAADQHIKYPDDTAFNNVEQQNLAAYRWGS